MKTNNEKKNSIKETNFSSLTNCDKAKKSEEEKEEYILGNYTLGKNIGKGTFGKVKLGIHKSTGEKVIQNNKYIII